MHLQLGIVRDRRLSILGWYGDFEDAVLVLRHWRGVTVPIVEITDQICAQSIGRPFSIQNVAIVFHDEAELFKPLRTAISRLGPQKELAMACPRELLHAAFGVLDRLQPLLCFCVAAAESRLEWIQVRVELANSCMLSERVG